MKCQICGYETDSDKVFQIHENNCLAAQEENGLTNNKETDSEKMDWQQLKKYAAEKGIDVKGKKKEEIFKCLTELGGKEYGNNNSSEGAGNSPDNG